MQTVKPANKVVATNTRNGLVPGDSIEATIRCVVKIHTDRGSFQEINFQVFHDDTLLDVKKRVVSLNRVTKAVSSHELFAWRTLESDSKTTSEYIVDVAMDSGGTSVIGPRIVSASHLEKVFYQLTGKHTSMNKLDKLASFFTWNEALGVVSGRLKNSHVSFPIGMRHELGWNAGRRGSNRSTVMIANPFVAPLEIDPNMASLDGDTRDVYTTHTEQDGDTLETIYKASMSLTNVVIKMDMTSIHDVWAHVLKHSTTDMSQDGLRVGFVRKYFPLGSSWMHIHNAKMRNAEAFEKNTRQEKHAFLSSDQAIAEVKKSIITRNVTVDHCVLTNITIHYRSSDALARASQNESKGLNLLSAIYSKFRLNRDVPVVRYNNGYTSSYKISQAALTTHHQEVRSYLAKCVRAVAMSSSAKIKASLAALRQSLHFMVTLGHGDFVIVHLRHDMSYDIVRQFSSSGANGGGSFEDVARAHHVVSRKVIQVLQGILVGVNASSVLVVEDTLNRWEDFQSLKSLVGTTLTFGTVSTILVKEETVPSIKMLRDVVDKMFPFFVPVTIPSNGNSTIFMQYRRVDRFSQTDGLLQTLRVIRDDPMEMMIKKIARAFGISETEASTRIDAELVNGKVPFIPAFLQSGTTISLSPSQRGIVCNVNGSTSAAQHRRILRLVSLAVSVACDKHSVFLEWVTKSSRSHDASLQHVVESQQKTKHHYLEDWEDVDVDEEDNRAEEKSFGLDDSDNLELNALFAADLGVVDDGARTSPIGLDPMIKSVDNGQVDTNLSLVIGPISHDAILKQIQRSDPTLFNFKGSKYSTKCGKVDGRQPIVVTKFELSQMKRGAHTGAIAYGTSEAAAQNNRFICPDVWCPRSRTGMSFQQFSDNSKKCPIDDEVPIIADNKYFKGKSGFPGFLNPSQHPDGMCMPCCFRLPSQRVGMCSHRDNPGFFEIDETSSRDVVKREDLRLEKEEDPRYLRNFKAPLDDRRYGLLPKSFIDLLGIKQRCGSREDGSGQMGMHTNCFVRRGTIRHVQSFMSSVVWILENPLARDIKSFVSLIEINLTPDVFVTLNDGRLARAIMQDLTYEGLRVSKEGLSKFSSWICGPSAEAYVVASNLKRIVSEARSHLSGAGSFPRSSVHVKSTQPTLFQNASMEFKREYVLFASMLQFLELLRDPSTIKGHEHLMDLCCRPLSWLNPQHKNILLFESEGNDGDDGVYFTCPFDGGQLERRLRLSDPIAMMIRKGDSYHPIIKVQMSRQDGIIEQGVFFYDVDRFVHQLVYRVLEGCKTSPSSHDVIGSLLVGLVTLGQTPRWQVLDYDLRLVGILTDTLKYIALQNVTSPLVGEASAMLGTLYISDAMDMIRADKSNPDKIIMLDLLERLRRVTGVEFTSPQSHMSTDSHHVMLDHLGIFIGLPIPDQRTFHARESDRFLKDRSFMVEKFRSALWDDANAASELAFIRHGFNPLPPKIRRELMSQLVIMTLSMYKANETSKRNKEIKNSLKSSDTYSNNHSVSSKQNQDDISRLVDSLLYDEDPLQSQTLSLHHPKSKGNSINLIMLMDSDLLSVPLDELLVPGRTSLDGPPSGIESVAMPGTRVNRDASRGSRLSVSHSGSGSLLSLRKSLFDSTSLQRFALSHHASESVISSMIPGTRMIRSHPWRAISLAHQLMHTELRMPVETPMLVMLDNWIDGGKKSLSPGDALYQPSLRDIQILSKTLSVPVMVIEQSEIVFDQRSVVDLCLILAHVVSGDKWFLILDDVGRMLWKNEMANKIHLRLQKRGV